MKSWVYYSLLGSVAAAVTAIFVFKKKQAKARKEIEYTGAWFV